MSGFIRRFTSVPATETITQIEGVVIIDLPPPGTIQGVGQGPSSITGEFSNMTQAVSVSASGEMETDLRPVEVFSSQDMVDKTGPFDELLGEFGGDMGNGFVEVRNKRFSRLILMPIDLITPAAGTTGALRVWRELPTNNSATDATPIVPISAAVVEAGSQFERSNGDQLRLASRVTFLDDIAYASGTDGITTTAASSTVQSFSASSGNFVNLDVSEGDGLVLGVIGASGATGFNADTYRVVSVTDSTHIVVETLDGTAFSFSAGSSQPWRLHVEATFDSDRAGHQFAEGAGYDVLARPLTATIPAGTLISPSTAPPANSATSWDPLSGLAGAAHPILTLTYDANLHAANVATNATIEGRYQAAIDALLSDEQPQRDVKIMTAARKSNTIRTKLRTHVGVASQRGLTRRCVISPAVSEESLSTVINDSAPGVGANRSDRVDYSWPAVRTSVPEAVDFTLATSDGKTTTDGILDVTADTWLMAVESNLDPWRNPGQGAEPVLTVMSPVVGFARGMPKLAMPEYIQLRASGIAAVRFDRVVGPIFQSGVTTSLVSGEKNIMRRRMADYLQDSIAQALVPLSKLPMTELWKDNVVTETDAFLLTELSPNNKAAQHIAAYNLDSKSGNTATLEAQGIFVLIITVRLIATADDIVLQTNISENAVVVTTL